MISSRAGLVVIWRWLSPAAVVFRASRRRVVSTAAIGFLAVLALSMWQAYLTTRPSFGSFTDYSTSRLTMGVPKVAVHQPFEIGIAQRNASTSASLVLRPVTFAGGLPPNVRVVRQVASSPPGGVFYAGVGWRPYPDYSGGAPIDGYRVASGRRVFVVIEFEASKPGVVDISRVVLHAGHPGPVRVLPFGSTMTSYVDTGYYSFCVAVSVRTCSGHLHQVEHDN